MGLQLIFADSFAHYDQAGVGIGKWDVPGGKIETDPSHVRTGPQSLHISAANAPSLTNRLRSTGFSYCVLGFAWQTSSLAGETICQCVESSSGDVQIYLVQNADGSLSLWSGAPDTLLATSAPGTITTGVFWYIELSVYLDSYLQQPQVIVTVTSSPGGVATEVINVIPVTTSQGGFNEWSFIGPAGDAWLADVYVLGQWDGNGDPQAVMGAPKWYGLNVPVADGLDYVSYNTVGKTTCFNESVPPLYPQCDSIPQDEALYLTESDHNPIGQPSWVVAGQAFDVSSVGVPAGSIIAAVQEVVLLDAGAGTNANVTAVSGFVGYDGGSYPANFTTMGIGDGLGLSSGQMLAWSYFLFAATQNPVTAADWDLAEFGAGLQFGVLFGEPS